MGAVMSKYKPLFEHLCRAGDEPLEMAFDEIDRLVGGLPASATTQRAWWSNDSRGARPAQAKAWLDAGRVVEFVDPSARRVRFSAARWTRGA
jgi:hypothetical protein